MNWDGSGGRRRVRLSLVLHTLLSFVLMVTMVACDNGNDVPPAPAWPTAHAQAQGGGKAYDLDLEIANTESRREQGLMFRQSLDDSHGMLFIFGGNRDVTGAFWMKNTYIPLDIAYLDANGTVLEVHDGKPLDETPLRPKQPYRYALEVAGGWFDRHGLGEGARIVLPANLPAGE